MGEEEKYGEDLIAGTRMNKVIFIQPVYPGDELYTIVKVINKKESKREAGILTVMLSTFNHKEEKVFQGELSALIKNDCCNKDFKE